MKLIPATTLALTALLHVTYANFDIYSQGVGGDGISGNTWGYQVYDTAPDCGDVHDWIWRKKSDVSGGKYGVRCKGKNGACNASGDPSGIEEMEFNFNTDEHHWTIYANRGWGLFDKNDKQVGTCMPYPNDDFYCGKGAGRAEGERKVRCLTNSVNSGDINAHRPK